MALLVVACGGGGGGGSGATPAPVNIPPTAEAGASQTVDASVNVTLDANGSRDSDGSIASYEWSQTEGPSVELSDNLQPQVNFIAPRLAADPALAFALRITDADCSSATDSVVVTVRAALQPPPPSITGDIPPPAIPRLD